MMYEWQSYIALEIEDPAFKQKITQALDDIASTPDGSILKKFMLCEEK